MGEKLAVVVARKHPETGEVTCDLVVAGITLDVAYSMEGVEEIREEADRINAAVDAEVERRLDEITKGAC